MNYCTVYILSWCLCLLTAGTLLIRKRHFRDKLSIYRGFLFEPWKTITFVVAAAGITLAAPYSGDPTWDYFDGAAISILTFVTAPWAVGAVFRSVKTRTNWIDIFIALCLMLFSSSWSYDAYIYWRDGTYPATWLSNLIIAPNFYIAGGLFWNLEYHKERGIIFSFQRDTWYHEINTASFWKLIWVAIPFIVFAMYGVVWFVWTD
jgi:hypothetical protein